MIKALYYARVLFISLEFLCLVTFFCIYYFYAGYIASMLNDLSVNEEAVKWMLLYPIGLVGWMFLTGTSIIFPDEKVNKILHEWPDYWKLKAHFNVGLYFSVMLAFISFLIWLFDKIGSSVGAWMFSACCVSISIAALSFYNATISIKSILVRLRG